MVTHKPQLLACGIATQTYLLQEQLKPRLSDSQTCERVSSSAGAHLVQRGELTFYSWHRGFCTCCTYMSVCQVAGAHLVERGEHGLHARRGHEVGGVVQQHRADPGRQLRAPRRLGLAPAQRCSAPPA